MLAIIYNQLELYTLIPRLIEIFFFIIVGLKILRQKKYILNRVYFIAFMCWAGYITIDIFVWTLAVQNIESYQIANSIRDIQLTLALSFSYLIYLATNIIKRGSKVLTSFFKKRITIELIALFFIMYFANKWEDLIVIDSTNIFIEPFNLPPTGEFNVIISQNPGAIFGSFGIFTLIFASIINIIFIIKNGELEEQYKIKMYYLAFGITLVPIGMIYFVIINIYVAINIFTCIIGHLIWTLAPLFIYISKRDIKENQGKLVK